MSPLISFISVLQISVCRFCISFVKFTPKYFIILVANRIVFLISLSDISLVYRNATVRILVIKKTRHNKCWQEYGEKGIQTGITTIENSVEVLQEIKNRITR